MTTVDLKELEKSVLNTDDTEMSVLAIEKSVSICRDLAKSAVLAFLKSDGDGYLIAERLAQFGSLVGEFALTEYERISDESKKTLLALVLYKIGHPVSKELFLERLSYERPSGFLSLMLSSLRDDLKHQAIPIVLRKANEILLDDNLGSSFASNVNKDALLMIVNVLESYSVTLDKEFKEQLLSAKNLPLELQRVAGKSDRSDRLPQDT
ncbi:MAG: hypothetical protein H8F28_25690 [Fibrella sp.]|nr:hypothetical protein [Armatimonadota bacterium]